MLATKLHLPSPRRRLVERARIIDLLPAIQTAESEVGVDALALLEAGGATPTEAVAT